MELPFKIVYAVSTKTTAHFIPRIWMDVSAHSTAHDLQTVVKRNAMSKINKFPEAIEKGTFKKEFKQRVSSDLD